MNMLVPMDVHADQTELMQILQKGHHNVSLQSKEIEKLACWIDLNAPFHGRRSDIATWHKTEQARNLRKIYAQMFDVIEPDLEYLPEIPTGIVPVVPVSKNYDKGISSIPGWPLQRSVLENMQLSLGVYQESIPLSDGIFIEMVKVPDGKFIMGSTDHPR
jgi:hypothetical protein